MARQGQHRQGARSWQSLAALLLLLITDTASVSAQDKQGALLGSVGNSGVASHCRRQRLLHCMPRDLGVIQVEMLGELYHTGRNVSEVAVFRAFIRVQTEQQQAVLFGYGWFEDVRENKGIRRDAAGINSTFGPNHKPFLLKRLPALTLRPMVDIDWSTTAATTVQVSIPEDWNKDYWALRLDARVAIPPQGAHLFELRFAGWTQSAHFSTHTQIVKPGVLLPWRRPASAPAALTFDPPLPPQPQPPAAQSPLVAVVFAAFSIRSEKHLLFLAQQILRHIEYHLLEIQMQRYILYIRESLFGVRFIREYLHTHIHPDALPYVTVVIWNPFPYVDPYWDQTMVYYHAHTALSQLPNTFISLIDFDEYIAFSSPTKTIHEALALKQCSTDTLVSVRFPAYPVLSPRCAAQYKTDVYADRAWWASCAARPAGAVQALPGGWINPQAKAQQQGVGVGGGSEASQQCRWYTQDPLPAYNRTWDAHWFRAFGRKYASLKRRGRWDDRTNPNLWRFIGKHMTRVNGTKVFNQHRVELLPGAKEAVMDPEAGCPYVVHLLSLNGQRPGNQVHFMNNITHYNSKTPVRWWKVQQQQQKQQTWP